MIPQKELDSLLAALIDKYEQKNKTLYQLLILDENTNKQDEKILACRRFVSQFILDIRELKTLNENKN